MKKNIVIRPISSTSYYIFAAEKGKIKLFWQKGIYIRKRFVYLSKIKKLHEYLR